MKTLRVIPLDPNFTKSTEYGRKHGKDSLGLGTRLEFGDSELFFTSEIKKTEATALGNFLVKAGLSKAGFHTVQLDKKNGKFLCRTSLNVEQIKKAEKTAVEFFQSFVSKTAAYFSISVFKGAPVEVHLW